MGILGTIAGKIGKGAKNLAKNVWDQTVYPNYTPPNGQSAFQWIAQTSNVNGQSRFDMSVATLADMMNASFSRIDDAAKQIDPSLYIPLSPLPTLNGDNVEQAITTVDYNVRLVDAKVQSVGRASDRQQDLAEMNRRLLERTNRILEEDARRRDSQRFSNIENQMEAAAASSAMERRIQLEVDRRIAELEARLAAVEETAGTGGDIISQALGMLGIGGTAAAAGAGGAAAAGGGAALATAGAAAVAGVLGIEAWNNTIKSTGKSDVGPTPEQAAQVQADLIKQIQDKIAAGQALDAWEQGIYTKYTKGEWGTTPSTVGPQQIRKPTEEYANLSNQLETAKGGESVFSAQYDVFDLVARAFFTRGDSFDVSVTNKASLHGEGEVSISSSTRLVITAPEIVVTGKLVFGGLGTQGNGQQGATPVGGTGGDGTKLDTSYLQGPGASLSGPQQGSGGSGIDVPAGGDYGGNKAAEAYNFFKSKGWTDEQAAALAGNIMQESGFDHTNVGDGGQAYGIGQWHPPRQADFERQFGKKIQDSTYQEQLAFMDWELRNTEKRAGNSLAGAKTVEEATVIVSNQYERPDPSAANNPNRIGYAQQYFTNRDSYAELGKPKVGSGTGELAFDKNKLGKSEWESNDPRINDIVAKGAEIFGEGSPYGIRAFSGNEGRGQNHRGYAVDWEVYNKETGETVPQPYLSNSAGGGWTKEKGTGGATENFRLYESAAQAMKLAQMRDYPELNDKFRYGGYFGGKMGSTYGANDSMHVDITPTAGGAMAAGSWSGGLRKGYEGVYDKGSDSQGLGDLMNMESDKAIAEYRKRLFAENNWVEGKQDSGFQVASMGDAPDAQSSKGIVTKNDTARALAFQPITPKPDAAAADLPLPTPQIDSKTQKNTHDGVNMSSIDLLELAAAVQ